MQYLKIIMYCYLMTPFFCIASLCQPFDLSLSPHFVTEETKQTMLKEDETFEFDAMEFISLSVGGIQKFIEIDSYPLKYQHIVIDFMQTMQFLGFKMRRDTESLITGWIIGKTPQFQMDLQQHIVTIKGVPKSYHTWQVAIIGERVYFDPHLLAQWFPVKVIPYPKDRKPDYIHLAHNPGSSWKLPVLKQHEAEITSKKASQDRKQGSADEHIIAPDYSLFSWPDVDVNFNKKISDHRENALQYNLLAYGDLLWMSSELFANPDNLRLTLSRKDSNARLLGNLQATQVALGDVTLPTMPLLANTTRGLGVSVTNHPLHISQTFNHITIEGNALPNAIVELYDKNHWLEQQLADKNGRYRFEQVQLHYGKNSFTIKITDSIGNCRTEPRDYYIENSIPNTDGYTYTFSILQNDRDLFNHSADSDHADMAFAIRLDKRWLSNLSSTVGIAQTAADEHQQFAHVGLRGYYQAFFSSADFALTRAGGHAYSVTLQSKPRSGWDINFNHDYLADFTPANLQQDKTAITTNTQIRLNKRFQLTNASWLQRYFSAGLTTLELNSTSSGSEQHYQLSGQLSLTGGNYSLNNKLFYTSRKNANTMNGTMQLRKRWTNLLLTSQINYDLQPDFAIQNISLNGNWYVKPKNTLSFAMNWQQTAADRYRLGYSQQSYPWLNYGGFIQYDETTGWQLGISLAFSMTHRKQKGWRLAAPQSANKANAQIRFFDDQNYNRQWDEGEPGIENLSIAINQQSVNQKSNHAGDIELYDIPTDKPITIAANEQNMDAKWFIAYQPQTLLPRPGITYPIHIPLQVTGEISGYIHHQKTTPLAVRLLKQEHVVKEPTELYDDGYFYLDQVLPGQYQLQVIALSTQEPEILHEQPITIQGNQLTNQDIQLKN